MQEDDGGGADAAPPSAPGEQQTIPIPLSAFPVPPKPGGMVQLKVISIDQNAGAVNAVVMAPDTDGGSDSLANEFNS